MQWTLQIIHYDLTINDENNINDISLKGDSDFFKFPNGDEDSFYGNGKEGYTNNPSFWPLPLEISSSFDFDVSTSWPKLAIFDHFSRDCGTK